MLEERAGKSDAILIGALSTAVETWKIERILFDSKEEESGELSPAIDHESNINEVSEVLIFSLVVTPPTSPSSSQPTTHPEDEDPHFLCPSSILSGYYDDSVIGDDDSYISEQDIFFDVDPTYHSTPSYTYTLFEPTPDFGTSFVSYSTLYPDEEDDEGYFETIPIFDTPPPSTKISLDENSYDDSYFDTLPNFDDEIKLIPPLDHNPFDGDSHFVDFRAGRPLLPKKTLNPELRKHLSGPRLERSLRILAVDNCAKIVRAEELRSRSKCYFDVEKALDEHYEDEEEGDEIVMYDYYHTGDFTFGSDLHSAKSSENIELFDSSFVHLPALRKPFQSKRSGRRRVCSYLLRQIAIYKGVSQRDSNCPILSYQQLEILQVTQEQAQRVHAKLAGMGRMINHWQAGLY